MNVVHGIAWYAPESWGGTEQYVSGLATSLARIGARSSILAPGAGDAWREYEHQGVRVARHPAWRHAERRELLAEWFRSSGADVFHQHSWTPDAGLAELWAAKDSGLRTVLTVHIPAPVCARGTMMLWGKRGCDGEILERRCSACWVHSHGAPALASRAIAAIPAEASARMARWLPHSRLQHALRSRVEMRNRRAAIDRVDQSVDCVVAVSTWLRDALVLNGVSKERLVLSRQAIEPDWLDLLAAAKRQDHDGVRILCAGRWDPLKGQHVLVEAIRRVRGAKVRVRFAAPEPASGESADYRDRVLAMAAGDPRIELCKPAGRDWLAAEFANADLLAVPSQWFETGPLVVLEAKAAGLPVLGSALGGIAELVRPGVDGWLVPHDDARAWARSIESFSLGDLAVRPSSDPVRTMNDVAREMLDVYSMRRNSEAAA